LILAAFAGLVDVPGLAANHGMCGSRPFCVRWRVMGMDGLRRTWSGGNDYLNT
jgi:hypothetical protein